MTTAPKKSRSKPATQAAIIAELASKLSQLELDFCALADKVSEAENTVVTPSPKPLTISDIPNGEWVQDIQAKRKICRVKFTGFLLNSSIVADVLNRGGCFVVSSSSTVYAVPSTRLVSRL